MLIHSFSEFCCIHLFKSFGKVSLSREIGIFQSKFYLRKWQYKWKLFFIHFKTMKKDFFPNSIKNLLVLHYHQMIVQN